MVHKKDIDYLQSMNAEGDVITYFTDYPSIFRNKSEIPAIKPLQTFIVQRIKSTKAVGGSLIAPLSMLLLSILTFVFMNRWGVFGPLLSLIDLKILLLTFGLYLYCRTLAKRGVLK